MLHFLGFFSVENYHLVAKKQIKNVKMLNQFPVQVWYPKMSILATLILDYYKV